MNYLQGGNGDANIENGLANTEREGQSRGNGESSISIYTLSTVGWTASEKLLCSRGSPGWCSVMTWREEGREGMYVKLWLICIGVWQKPAQHCKKKN